jgi:hypothetical protein
MMMRYNPVLLAHPYARWIVYALAAILAAPYIIRLGNSARPYNGFDVSDSLIPVEQILLGGPERDGIPAIDAPHFISNKEVDFLQDQDRVLGLVFEGAERAYPVNILNYHEIVNDHIGDQSVTITWCPLCGSGMAFVADVNNRRMRFGVSGLLYNSDMLLYDRATHSLWSQLMHQAISGPLKGQKLEMLTLQQTSWIDWRNKHPSGQVLSRKTGYRRDYTSDPYPGYAQSESVFFSVNHRSRLYHAKERVIGVEIDGHFKAYPFIELSRHKGELVDHVGSNMVRVIFEPEHDSGRVVRPDGTEIPTVISYWFAWYAFHPQTDVFRATKEQ